jgi:hypothetical protein
LAGYSKREGRGMITRRGRIVRALAIGLLLAATFYASGHINWVGDGWCWGTITECYFTEGKGK